MSSKGRGTEVAAHEFYPTPEECTISLCNELDKTQTLKYTFGEPCIGDYAIADVLWQQGITNNEIPWAEIQENRDYLEDGLTGNVDAIITNPPFSLATQFIDKSLEEAQFSAYLLRLNFLGSQKRKEWWQNRMPTHLFVLAKRPSFTGKGTDSTEYAWFLWDELGLCKRPPGLYVI